jgi:chromatin assembly factor 1 subunit A
MRLAPSTRTKLTAELKQSLDQCIESQSQDKLYLDQLRSKKIIPQTSSSTWALDDFKDDEILILEDDDISGVTDNIVESYPTANQLPRPKLLQFWENRRPPYWGTWRKKSQSIRPKNPFYMDKTFFDYEVDSDDEWEEEEPGESLHGSDDEKESEDEYEVDNEFFVPHGYLSDEENVGEKDEDQSPEMLKIKLKLLELEFEEEMKQKTGRLKPRLFGCVWVDSKTADSASTQLLKLLSPYRAVYQDGPIVMSAPDSSSAAGSPEAKNQVPSPTTPLMRKKKFPEAAIPALIKLIHGNVNRREFLAKEFLAYWNKEQQRSVGDGMEEGSAEGNASTSQSCDIFKKSVTNKIKELASWMACPGGGPMAGRMCWYVPPETRALYGLADITLPNTLWNYTFKPKRRESDIHMASATSTALTNESNPKQLITKFTKKMTEVERKKQFNKALAEGAMPDKRQGDLQHDDITQKNFSFSLSNRATPTLKSAEQHKRKVPILTSFPKGQELATPHKNSLMKFMKPHGNIASEGKKSVSSFQNSDKLGAGEEECIVLSD